MANDKRKIFEQAKAAIIKNKLFFIEDVVAFLPIAIISIMSACTQILYPADRYAKTWSGHSFEASMKNNTAYSIKNAKDSLKDAKEDFRDKEKSGSQREKIIKVWDKTAKLKSEKND